MNKHNKYKEQRSKRRLSTRAMCERYGVVDRTIDRWSAAGILPPPLVINRRRYWDEDELEQRERDMTHKGGAEAAE
jgi:DNA-binding transcriptional MerR regulator